MATTRAQKKDIVEYLLQQVDFEDDEIVTIVEEC